MNINSISSSSVSQNRFQNAVKLNQNINSSVNFKGINSKNVLDAMDTKALSQKAHISFCRGAQNVEKSKDEIRQEKIAELIHTINITPDDEINGQFVFQDDFFNEYRSTLLIEAVLLNSPEAIELLIKRGVDVNQGNYYGQRALTMASQKGYPQAVEALLKAKDINVNYANKYGHTALIYAADEGHTETVEELLKAEGIDVNQANNDGSVALIDAARWGYTQTVKALLNKEDIDVNHANKYGETALMKAAIGAHTETVKALLEAEGIDVNQADRLGDTALIWAVKYANNETVKALLEAEGN